MQLTRIACDASVPHRLRSLRNAYDRCALVVRRAPVGAVSVSFLWVSRSVSLTYLKCIAVHAQRNIIVLLLSFGRDRRRRRSGRRPVR